MCRRTCRFSHRICRRPGEAGTTATRLPETDRSREELSSARAACLCVGSQVRGIRHRQIGCEVTVTTTIVVGVVIARVIDPPGGGRPGIFGSTGWSRAEEPALP